MKKRVCIIFIILSSILPILSGCSKKEVETETTQEETAMQIGMSFDSFVIERWQRDRDIFVSTAKELGAEVNVQNANGDIEEQIKQIEYFIEKKVDAIVIICISSDALDEVVKKAKNQGIKVVAYDRLIKNSDVDLYISFDNKAVGEMMASALLNEKSDMESLIMLNGPTADNNVAMVENGFRGIMDSAGVTIKDVYYCDGWKPELAASYIYEYSDRIREVDAIMCGNDSLATYSIRALAEKRLAGSVLVAGQDADLEACQRIVEGTQVVTIYKPVERLAQTAAEYTVRLIKKEKIEGLSAINDGKYNIPAKELEPIPVTKSNIDEVIIGSGFHRKDDVYLNISK